jgi:hypothetical protein
MEPHDYRLAAAEQHTKHLSITILQDVFANRQPGD